MPVIHFLNVLEGDCSIIQHGSGHVTVIDVNNAKQRTESTSLQSIQGLLERFTNEAVRAAESSGNFQQKKWPVNPILYMQDRGINEVFRFFLTHPDMDHMGGIKDFFETFRPGNIWDTENTKEMESFEGSPYNEDDWTFYKSLRDNKPETNPRRLVGYSGVRTQFINLNEQKEPGGDGIYILSPTRVLVDAANEEEEYHKASYVIQYQAPGGTVVFGGDSHDESWEHILNDHKDVANIDLLIAPHHGRASGRSYRFLDTLKPKLTFFGNASSEHLAYEAWNRRGLPYITNNQANCVVVEAGAKPMAVYVTNEAFARSRNSFTFYSETYKAWYLQTIL